MYLIILIISAYCSAWCVVNIIDPSNFIKKLLKLNRTTRLKPIDCVQCLSFWFTFVLFLFPSLAPVGYAFTACWLGAKLQ